MKQFQNIRSLKTTIKRQDRVSLILHYKEFQDISFRRSDAMTSELILNRISDIVQSNAPFFLNDELTLQIDHISMPIGNGRI